MDLHVAVFLIIFLCISSLTTLLICFVELRSCWRNYNLKQSAKSIQANDTHTAEIAKAIGVNQAELEAEIQAGLEAPPITDEFMGYDDIEYGNALEYGYDDIHGCLDYESHSYESDYRRGVISI